MDYIIPGSVREIKKELGTRPGYFAAGCTDLMVLKKEGQLEDRPWIDISRLEELKGIRLEEGCLRIGALATMAELAADPLVKEHAPAMAAAAGQMGSPLIRNLATIGGNLSNSNPAGDTIPCVNALDAVLVLQKENDIREVPAHEFCTAPCENVLSQGEILTAVRIPVRPGKSAFIKLGPRRALAISKVSLAVRWVIEKGLIEDIRICMGAVGPKCMRARRTEEMMKGGRLNAELVSRASHMIGNEACPIDDFRSSETYRRQMLGVLLKRVF
ncbi:MAG: xanthine dehydrogenase family protein subunit M [Elusimicrobia bacterium]|nr:xanthine dehydrogenase family protein subunit M [Elusimicrobiota bacterium]